MATAKKATGGAKEGANLKPGVKGTPKTPEEMKRKGSFLRRHFANLRGPLVDENGDPTRLALQAQAWGEKVPKTEAEAKKLADKGTKLLEQYHQAQGEGGGTKPAAKKASGGTKAKPGTAKKSSTKKESK